MKSLLKLPVKTISLKKFELLDTAKLLKSDGIVTAPYNPVRFPSVILKKFGLVPNKYSAKLIKPSPSGSSKAISADGSKPFSKHHLSGIPSLFVSGSKGLVGRPPFRNPTSSSKLTTPSPSSSPSIEE